MDLRMRVPHIVRVTTKGRTCFYHRKTRERLPDDEEARVLRAIQINGEKNFVRVIREKKPTGSITGYVYLVINKATGKLKIGYSKNPLRRIEDMQVANDGALRLIAVMVGSVTRKEDFMAC